MEKLEEAKWTTKFINDLPDSSFLYVEPGGKKDEDDKTTPRSLRHLPYRNAEGEIEMPHFRNALARLPQTDLSEDVKAKIQAKADKIKKELDMGEEDSLEEKEENRRRKIQTALTGLYGSNSSVWIVSTYEDKVIVSVDGKYIEYPYTVKDDTVELGTPKEVKKKLSYESFKESYEIDFAEAKISADEKKEVDIQIVEKGMSLNNRFYKEEALREAAPLYEGSKVFADHNLAKGSRSVRDLIGYIKNPYYSEEGKGGLRGTLKAVDEKIWTLIKESINDGMSNFIGLSHVVWGDGKAVTKGGKSYIEVNKILGVESVDIVMKPAAGGKFLKLVASLEGEEMDLAKLTKEEILADRPDIAEEFISDAIDKLERKREMDENEKDKGKILTEEDITKIVNDKVASVQKLTESRIMVTEIVTASKLPDQAKNRIKEKFDGKIPTKEEIDLAVTEELDYISSLTPKPDNVKGMGGGASGMVSPLDKVTLAMEAMFDSECKEAKEKGITPFRSIRHAFTQMYGEDILMNRSMVEEVKPLIEEITTSTFSYILGTSMHKRLVKDYNLQAVDWRKVVSVDSPQNFKNQSVQRVAALDDLSTVDTESTSYPELGTLSDEEINYAVLTRGAIVTIARKTIINDDMRFLRKIPVRLARAAARTLEKYVFSTLLADNPTYDVDSKALFHADHANLGSSALAEAAVTAAIAATMKQSDGDERIGIKPAYLLVPPDLMFTAQKLLNSAYEVGATNETINVLKGILEQITVKHWTDTNNWFTLCDPNDVETIVLGFLNGQETPEMFLQDSPVVGTVFTHDKIRYKIRHEYAGEIVDYRGAYGSIVG